MEKNQGPFPVGSVPSYPCISPVPNPEVSQPQQPNVNIAVSSQQTNQQPVQQQGQPPAYQPQVVQPVTQVVMIQAKPTHVSTQMTCPHCKNTVMTQLKYTIGVYTWLTCGVLGIIGCLPCMVIPFFVDSCKDVEHSCSSCGNILHIHRRI